MENSHIKKSFAWIDASNGVIPENAISISDSVYVGRALHDYAWVPGTICVKTKKCYVPYGLKAYEYSDYEVLCDSQSNNGQTHYQWVSDSCGSVPKRAITCGEDQLFIAKATLFGQELVGKVATNHNCAYIPWNGKEYPVLNYEVLVYKPEHAFDDSLTFEEIKPTTLIQNWESEFCWSDENKSDNNSAKNMNINKTDTEDDTNANMQDKVYHAYLSWVPQRDGRVPKNGVHISSTAYVARVLHEGEWTPGMACTRSKTCYIPSHGIEHFYYEYEVLCDTSMDSEKCYKWVNCANGEVPEGAVVGGMANDGEYYYVAKGKIEGHDAIGKVYKPNKCAYLQYGGYEHAVKEYEVLVVKKHTFCSKASPRSLTINVNRIQSLNLSCVSSKILQSN